MRRAGSWYLVFVGLLFCAAGGPFAWLMWRSYERASDQQSWVETEGLILDSRVEERKIGAEVGTEYRFAVLYGYEFGGERFTSERYSLRGSPWSASAERAERLVKEHAAGSKQPCYVDPARPEFAVLKRDSRGPGYSLWFPLLIVAGGVGIIAGAIRGMLAARRAPDGEGREGAGDPVP